MEGLTASDCGVLTGRTLGKTKRPSVPRPSLPPLVLQAFPGEQPTPTVSLLATTGRGAQSAVLAGRGQEQEQGHGKLPPREPGRRAQGPAGPSKCFPYLLPQGGSLCAAKPEKT